MNIKVGQKVFVKSMYNRNTFVEEPIVTKIGRKYFELSDYPYVKFELETGQDYRGEYNSNYQVYESKEAYKQEKIHNKLADTIRKTSFSYLKYSTLLAIQKLIEDDKNNK
jgi:hypothetical protein